MQNQKSLLQEQAVLLKPLELRSPQWKNQGFLHLGFLQVQKVVYPTPATKVQWGIPVPKVFAHQMERKLEPIQQQRVELDIPQVIRGQEQAPLVHIIPQDISPLVQPGCQQKIIAHRDLPRDQNMPHLKVQAVDQIVLVIQHRVVPAAVHRVHHILLHVAQVVVVHVQVIQHPEVHQVPVIHLPEVLVHQGPAFQHHEVQVVHQDPVILPLEVQVVLQVPVLAHQHQEGASFSRII